MDTILKFIKKPILPTGKNFFLYVLFLVVSSSFFHLIYYAFFLSELIRSSKLIGRNFKKIATVLLFIFFIILNIFQILIYFNFKLPAGNILAIKYLVWIIEGLHFVMFAAFFYSMFNIVFLKFSPRSLIYFSMYNFMHAVFGNCPMISLQNLFNPLAGNELYLNIFWQGFFGQWSNMMRLVICIIMSLTFYIAFRQLKTLNLNFGLIDFCFPWSDWRIIENKKKKIVSA